MPKEEPKIFDITEPEKLSGRQAFFEGAVFGDKLLVFEKSAKAVIYSPSRNIVVNSGPLTSGSQDAPEKTGDVLGTEKKKIQIEIRNGTTTVGLAKKQPILWRLIQTMSLRKPKMQLVKTILKTSWLT